LDNFEGILHTNPDLATAMELCKEIEALEPNAEALVVGGSVRDLILKKAPKDIDIATNVDIEKIATHFHSADIGKSKDFGIVAVQYKGQIFEVAHYREDVYTGTTDSRHPSGVNLTKSFEADSERRDITINSLGLTTSGEIVDYQGGLEDIKNGIIKAVGSPKDRFIEDALRMMRVGRFMARYGFKLDPETRQAIIDLKDLIKKVSPERIRDELFKSASSGTALANYIEHLKDVGLLALILPEIDIMDKYEHTPESHPEGGVFAHTIQAIRKSPSKNPITNMAILFHDIGKPASQSFDIDTHNVKYHGHDKVGSEVFDKVVKRLKFTNDQRDAILFAIENHMLAHHMTDMKKSRILDIRQSPHWETLKDTTYADDAARGDRFDANAYADKMNKVEDIASKFGEKQAFEKRMSGYVDGRMIMNILPKIKGTDIGVIKNAVREWIISKDFNVQPEEVTEYIKELGKSLNL
jgi:tRNA nucleotidyltransferase/poly(A) polymerase